MSTTSPQAREAGENAAWQAQLAKMLAGVAVPELQMLLGGRTWTPATQRWVSDSGVSAGGRVPGEGRTAEYEPRSPEESAAGHWEDVPGSWGPEVSGLIPGMLAGRDAAGRLPEDARILAEATAQLNRGYGQAGFGQRELLGYQGLRSGEGRLSPGAMNAAWRNAATSLERDRMAALANLNFMSAQTSMSDYNKLLSLMGQGVQTSLGLAQGFSGASNAALGGLSTSTQAGSILGGAASGASLGTTVYPGWGTVIGAAVGAGAGALGYGA